MNDVSILADIWYESFDKDGKKFSLEDKIPLYQIDSDVLSRIAQRW